MRQIILLIAAVALVGCGESKEEKAAKAKAIVEAEAAVIKKAAGEAQANAFVNTLGMKFVPGPGTDVRFCIWETRVKDYAAYAAANSEVDESWKKPIEEDLGDVIKQADTHPVVMVSWDDARAFCAWLTKKELAEGKIKAGQKYRSPRDVEWSVAVGLGKEKGNTPQEKNRGVKDVYPWGKEWPPPKGAGNYGQGLTPDNFEYTSPVGNFVANQLGLYDLGGNVWEWCEDRYMPTVDPRVLRGASWASWRHPRHDVVVLPHLRLLQRPRFPLRFPVCVGG